MEIAEPDGKIVLSSISLVRAACFVFIQAFRFGIASVLLGSGVVYLLYTIDIGDIMLNTLALEFVLHIDAMIFTTFSPRRIKVLLGDMEDLALPHIPSILGVDGAAVAKALLVSLALALSFFLLLLPQLDLLWLNKDALCSGNVNFVYAASATGGPWWGKSSALDEEPDPRPWRWPSDELANANFATKLLDTVLEGASHAASDCKNVKCDVINTSRVNWGVPTCCWTLATETPSISSGDYSVEAWAALSVDGAVEKTNPYCQDFMDIQFSTSYVYFLPFADALSSEDCPRGCPDRYRPYCRKGECVTPSCKDAAPFCREDSLVGMRSRQSCPLTCQCHVPNSTQLLSGPRFGCGPFCASLPSYREIIQALPCEDALNGSAALIGFANEWARQAAGWPVGYRNLQMAMVSTLNRSGCARYAAFTRQIFSLPYRGTDDEVFTACGGYHPTTNSYVGPFIAPIKTLHTICPKTCKCKKGFLGCPSTCPN